MSDRYATLSIRDLVVVGRHGSTGRERQDGQRFRVSIKITEDVEKAGQSDSIKDAFDYKIAKAIARDVIEKEHCVLIETIALRIATRLCYYEHVLAVKVKIKKLAVADCVPGVTFFMKRMPQEQEANLLPFDVSAIIGALRDQGGVSVPILSAEYRKILLEEARMYDYTKQDEVVGKAKVREELSSTQNFLSGSLFFRLQKDFEQAWNEGFEKSGLEVPFDTPLAFNEFSLQRYEAGSIGITPHVDGASLCNLICVFCLSGKARFALCDDRTGSNPRELETTPGNVIILRAGGFLKSDFRPFHFVTDVTEQRIVFGMRQKANKK